MNLRNLLSGDRAKNSYSKNFSSLDFIDSIIANELGPEYAEGLKMQKVRRAIELVEEKLKLKNKIIDKSTENPEFLYLLNETLKRLGL